MLSPGHSLLTPRQLPQVQYGQQFVTNDAFCAKMQCSQWSLALSLAAADNQAIIPQTL
jgi:hypothetical protein